jgi:hypothetical protein
MRERRGDRLYGAPTPAAVGDSLTHLSLSPLLSLSFGSSVLTYSLLKTNLRNIIQPNIIQTLNCLPISEGPTFLKSLHRAVNTSLKWDINLSLYLKGIVSRDWEQIHWIPSDWSEECRVAGAYFFPFLKPFLCFNLKNAWFGGFSFDSYSANDK